MSMIIHDGVVFDPRNIPTAFIDHLPAEIYHSTDAISKSGLDLIDKSPSHYHNAPPRVATRNMDIGSATHAALLEPDLFAEQYRVIDCADKRAKVWKDAVAEIGSERCLTQSEYGDILRMQAAIADDRRAAGFARAEGWRELSGFALDPETGVRVRVRFDLLTERGTAVDLKTSRDARSHEFARSVATYRYQVQAAIYSDAYHWITGERLESFRFLVIEPHHPYTVCHYVLDDEAMAYGRREYRRNLNTYAECRASGVWPKYEPESERLSLPNWLMAEIENEMEIAL